MGTFKDSLKKWFYQNDSVAAQVGTRVCLLDASGNPAGSDELLRTLTFGKCKDEYVDMGLPSGTLWAKKNLGAVSETDYGMYVSWGNMELHPEGDGYTFDQTTYDNSPAAAISADLTLSQDAARANLGGAWRMPTKEDFEELCNPTYTEYVDASGNVISGQDKRTTYNGVVGLLIRSKANGNTLFLPAAGYYSYTSISALGSGGFYWASSWVSSSGVRVLGFDSVGVRPQSSSARHFGRSVRAVF